MARKSTVAVLPQEVVAEVNRLIREGCTIDEILRALAPLGAPVSRSAMGRYVKGARESMEKYRQAQEVAKVWVDKLEAEPSGDVARLLPEMLRVVAFQSLTTMGEAEKPAKAMDVMLLAKALKDIAGTTKVNIDVEKQLRAMRTEVKKAATEVAATARSAGMSEELVAAIRTRVLGVGDRT